MDVRPILQPLPGESLVAVEPVLAPEPGATWNRRLHIHSGRTLSDIALTTEQNERAGRLALHGQLLSPGIVTGLEAGLEQALNTEEMLESYVHLNAGLGVTLSGEMVTVATALRVKLAALPIYAPSTLLDNSELPEAGGEVVRRLGPSLWQAIAQGVPLPRAGILVLQPVVAQIVGRADANDPCETDPAERAFDDWQLVDGCRLVFFTWPTDIIDLPGPDENPDLADTWRNRIAYAIFERERFALATFHWPWEELGVALGVVTLDAERQPLFLDRYSVVRSGGKAKERPALIAGGNAFLWQARLQQFAEQVATAELIDLTPAELAAQFHYLPPVGLLPKESVSWDGPIDHFFPSSYRVSARPVPLEQLDLVLRESAPLAPLHRGEAAQVELLVPVPQVWFDPKLLIRETVSAEFQQEINALTKRRAEWLARRLHVRLIASAFNQVVKGKPITYPTPDPEALDRNEAVQQEPLDPAETLDQLVNFREGAEGMTVEVHAIEELRTFLDNSTPLKDDEINQLRALGLEGFISFLDQKVRAANDTVDLSFLRVQTDIYRLRQQVLGAEEATRLATSPVLAAIAKGESAYATRKDLENFLAGLKEASPTQAVPAVSAAAAPQPATAPADVGNLLFVAGATGKRETIDTTALGSALERTAGGLDLTEIITQPRFAQETLLRTTKGGAIFTEPVLVRQPTEDDITEQTQIIGVSYDFRTTSVVERNPEPPAIAARSASVATKHTTISTLLDLGINVDDVIVPGFQTGTTHRPLKELRASGALDEILRGVHDPVPLNDRHESNFFNASVKALENTVGVLRGVEGQIKGYKVALARSRETLATLQKSVIEIDRRLKVIGDEVAEARHDVAVATTLLAEETKRIERINERRQKVRDQHAPFLVYRRPRVAQTVVQTPVRTIDPGFTQPPVTACFARGVNTPPDLQQMVNLLRRTPVQWFVALAPLLDQINRPQSLLLTVQAAKFAALAQQPVGPNTILAATPSSAVTTASTGVILASAIGKVLTTQQSVLSTLQLNTAALDLNEFIGASWQTNRKRAGEVVTVGNLIDGVHGQSEVARSAARELDDIAHVATCLYEELSHVEPILRLTWAELLSQYDAPVNLRNLASLPRWGEIKEVLDRREMQMLVDWLYSRVTPAATEAVDLMSDLVRICILLASHAPVNQIIAGAIHEPVVAKPGGQIKISVDPTLIRIGMPVFVYKNTAVVAQAVVNDLAGGIAVAHITETAEATLSLERGARVQFGAIPALRQS